VREIARRSLASAGYRIIEAHDGASALERSAAFPDPIHLLLTDVVMPGMDGVELAARLVAARSAMRVLYMSGYTDRAAIPGNPEVSCIAKPFTPVSLIRKVRETLGQALS
jgi:two-component system cell cycle sensor histidine kinase/response regulator CckA